MAHQSLYRRYRPGRFGEIKGQDHVVRALRNAAAEDRVGHAYLFSGPRGTGKTSTARILAKVLNCTSPERGEPCGTCESCTAIEAGTSFDVTELDAASNRGIDDVRDLIATTALSTPGRTRMYILDEVHMLTKEASAALLKTLEEPPDHVVFVLATTDPQKVLPTIRSRTQHLEFTLLPAEELRGLVAEVVQDAELDVDDAGRARALKDGAGSARDTLSALDRIVASGALPDDAGSAVELVAAIAEHDTGAAMVALNAAVERGRDPRVVGEQLLGELRDAFLVLMQGEVAHLTTEDLDRVRAQAERLRAPVITRALEAVGEALVEMRQAADPRIPLEVALVRLTRPELDPSPAALVERVERLERQARTGSAAPVSSTEDDADERIPAGATGSPDPSDSSPAAAARRTLAARSGPAETDPTPAAPGSPSGEASPAAQEDEPSRARPALGRRPADASAPAAQDGPPPSPGAGTDGSHPAPAAEPGDLPTRDQLTLVWGDQLLDGLRPKLKALFAAGRFVAVEGGVARFALPNDAHRERCEPFRADVEEALTGHFDRPVPLVLVVEGEVEVTRATPTAPAPSSGVRSGSGSGDEPEREEEPVDVSELEDAGDAATGVDQLAEVFGGVEVVEDGSQEGAP